MPEAVIDMLVLRFDIDGPDGPRTVRVHTRSAMIGRSRSQSDVVLTGPSHLMAKVNRRHAEVRVVDGRVMLIDWKSSTGTFVAGKRINAPKQLAGGETITIGPCQIVFTHEEDFGPLGVDAWGEGTEGADERPDTSPRGILRQLAQARRDAGSTDRPRTRTTVTSKPVVAEKPVVDVDPPPVPHVLPERLWPRRGARPVSLALVGDALAAERTSRAGAVERYPVKRGLMLDTLLDRLGDGLMPNAAAWALSVGIADAMSTICTMHHGPIPLLEDFFVDIDGAVTALVEARDHGYRMPTRELMEDVRESRREREGQGSQRAATILQSLRARGEWHVPEHAVAVAAFEQLVVDLLQAHTGIHWIVRSVQGQFPTVMATPSALGALVARELPTGFDEIVDEAQHAVGIEAAAARAARIQSAQQTARALDRAFAKTVVSAVPPRFGVPPWRSPRVIHLLDQCQDADMRHLRSTIASREPNHPDVWPFCFWRDLGGERQVWLGCHRDGDVIETVACSLPPLRIDVEWRDLPDGQQGPPTFMLPPSAMWPRPCPLGVPLAKVLDVIDESLRRRIVADVVQELTTDDDDDIVDWRPVDVDSIHLGVDGRARVLAIRGALAVVDRLTACANEQLGDDVRARRRVYVEAVRVALGVANGDDDSGDGDDSHDRVKLGALVEAHLDPAMRPAWEVAVDMATCSPDDLRALPLPASFGRLIRKRY